MTLTEIVSLELRCSSEAASKRFDELIGEEGHAWSCSDEKKRVCRFLYQLVDQDDREARMTLCPDTNEPDLAEEIVESVIPKVVRKLEEL